MDLEFGNYRLKRAERLLIGPEGPVELSAPSFDILAMLLEQAGRGGRQVRTSSMRSGLAWWWRKTRSRSTSRHCERRSPPG